MKIYNYESPECCVFALKIKKMLCGSLIIGDGVEAGEFEENQW